LPHRLPKSDAWGKFASKYGKLKDNGGAEGS